MASDRSRSRSRSRLKSSPLQIPRLFVHRDDILFSIFSFITFLLYVGGALYAAGTTWRKTSSPIPRHAAGGLSNDTLFNANHQIVHPIPRLMAEGEAQYRQKLARQSKTLAEAVKEYKRRYGRLPPKGFDKWFEYAKANDVVMIDEYDGMIDDLKAFWDLSGSELRNRAFQTVSLPSVAVVKVEKGKATVMEIPGSTSSESISRARGFIKQLKPFLDKIPDMSFPINGKAECRVLVPWEHLKYPNLTEQDSSKGLDEMLGGPFKEAWKGEGTVWDQYRRTCEAGAQSRRMYKSIRNRHPAHPVNHLKNHTKSRSTAPPAIDQEFSFMKNVDTGFDYCSNPWAHVMQGHFFSDFRTIPALYPIFSYGRGKGFMDIKIPSHYYYVSSDAYTYGWNPTSDKIREWDDMEVPWEQKSNKAFWRGTPRGGSTPRGFVPQYHRHRLNRLTNDASNTTRTIVYRDPTTQEFTQAEVPLRILNEVMDIGFTMLARVTGYPGGVRALYRDHRFAPTVPLGESWKHKFLIDLDGVGYSARFFALLASGSAPIKSTVYTEFFSDWIQPWVHFIPISQSYHELYNIYAFFNGPTESVLKYVNGGVLDESFQNYTGPFDPAGDRLLRRIALAGKTWKKKVGRKVDILAYTYRLCLEWGRLWSDDREAMTYKPKGYGFGL